MLQVNVAALLGIIGIGIYVINLFAINNKHSDYASLYRKQRKTSLDVCHPVDIFAKSVSQWDNWELAQLKEISNCIEGHEYFRPNQTYYFNYETMAKGMASGTTAQHIGINIKCQGLISANGSCKYSLQITKCILAEMLNSTNKYQNWKIQNDKSEELTQGISRYPVAFTMVRGAIGGVWTHSNEQLLNLNLKRGIITTFISKRKLKPSDFKEQEMRTDVQGVCPVHYEQSGSTVHLVKDMNKCHFPSRLDWPYSPWSLFWNMSFIQMFWINSTANCTYKFSYDGILQETTCDERHAIMLESTKDTDISVQTTIRQQLGVQRATSLQPIEYDFQRYYLKNIQYEYENTTNPKHNPQNLTRRVLSLLDKMATNEDQPIPTETANILDELIHLLRQSSDLSEINKHVQKCQVDANSTCTNANQIYNQQEVKVAQIWRDALIQCNRVSCIRAFRMLLETKVKHLDEIIGRAYLDFIFFSWLNVQINEIEIIEEILLIVKSRNATRLQIFALSSITNTYWTRHKDKLEKKVPTTLKNIVEFISKPINEGCATSGSQTEDITIALQAMSNMGNLLERVKPNCLHQLLRCIINKVHWSFSALAIKVTRRMNPTDNLYHFLLNILKNPDLKHEDQVLAYLILAKKFGNSELVKEVVKLLTESDESRVDYNLKTFLLSHMRAIAKSKDPEQARYANAIQAVLPNIQMFKTISEKIPDNQYCNDSSTMQDQLYSNPYNIPEDENLQPRKGYFSNYEEVEYSYGWSFLRESINRFGYGHFNSLLYSGTSNEPYASWQEHFLYLFGKKINVDSIFSNTKCVAEDIQASGLELDSSVLALIFQGFDANKCGSTIDVVNNKSNLWSKLPYQIDERILRNLISIEDQQIQMNTNTQKKTNSTTLLSFGFMDDILATVTFQELLKENGGFSEYKVGNADTFNSNYWKVVEAFNLVPTLIGLPLNWSMDAFFIHNSMNFKSSNGNFMNMNMKTANGFNALATLRNGMTLDLPGLANIGVQSISSIATSIGLNSEIQWDINKKMMNLKLDLPQRPMQLLSLTRRNFLIRNGKAEDIPDWDIDRITENWCSDKLVPLLGMKLCHSKSYPNVTHRVDKPWTLMAANSYWNYSTITVAKVPLQVAICIIEDNGITLTFEVNILSTDWKHQNKTTEMLKFVYKQKLATGEFQTKLMSFFAQMKASKENVNGNGYHFKTEYQILHDPTTTLNYQTKSTLQMLSEQPVKNHLSKSCAVKCIKVPVTEVTLNITSPENYYGFIYSHQKFPTSSYTNHFFQYKSLGKEPWLWQIIEDDTFREDSNSGWMELHQQVHNTVGSVSSTTGSRSYTYLKTPKSIFQLDTFEGSTTSTVSTIYINLTKHHLPDYNLMTFLNFTKTTAFHDESGLQTNVHNIILADPWYSISTEFISRYASGPPDNFNIKFNITRETLYNNEILQHRLQAADPHLSWMHKLSPTDDLQPSISYIGVDIQVKDNEIPQWESQMTFQSPYSKIPLAAKNVSASFIYYRKQNNTPTFELHFKSTYLYLLQYEFRYGRSFSLEIPTEDFRWNAILNLDFNLEKSIFLWQSNMSHISCDQIANYTFNISISKHDGQIYLSEDFNSEMYHRAIRLVTTYPVFFMTNFSLDMNITATSPFESLLNVNLRQQVGERNEVMNMTHQLVDIDVNGNWEDGYKKTFNFKSKNKDIVPNMVWNIDYPDASKGIKISLNFPDVSTQFYIFCQSNINSNQLMFTICITKNCTWHYPESEYFVAEVQLRLENPQKLTKTVIYNPKLMKELQMLTTQSASKVALAFIKLLSTSDHSTSVRSFLRAKTYTGSASVTIMSEIGNFLNYAGYVVIKDTTIKSLAISIPVNTMRYLTGTIIKNSYSEWFWNYFEIKDKIIPWTGQIARQIFREYMYSPGPVDGKSYIFSTSLPVFLISFKKHPIQLSPSLIRQLVNLRNSVNQQTSKSFHLYSDEHYNRQSLISKNGILHTFDGITLRDQSWMANEQCAYLLAHDFIDNKFTVYHKSGIQVLFPIINLGLSYHGRLTANGRHTDLPFETSNREIQVHRKGDFIQITTEYNFKLLFSLKNKYFIFYTNKHKHSQLIGMLGNNNDYPEDDLKDPFFWELTNNIGCKSIYKPDCHQKCNMYSRHATEWWTLMWRPDSPTLPCHDIVSLTAMAHTYNSCAKIPNDSIEAYLALCSAKGVPVGSLSDFIGECNRMKSWSAKIEGELEVIFLIDQTKRSPQNSILKGVETLVHTIKKYFLEEGYERIQFGLVGFKGQGYRYEPHQHTMNGELLADAKVFAVSGLKSLEFNGPKDNNGTAAMVALSYAAEHYALSQKAVHVFVMVTMEDEDTIAALSLVHDTLQKIALQSGTMYTIAAYSTVARSKGIYGIRGDGYVIPQPKTKDELFVDFPKGQLAKLSSATRGVVWQLNYLENVDIPLKRYAQAFASEMMVRSKQDSRLCRQCHCHVNSLEQILKYCNFVTCKDQAEKEK